MLLCLMDAVLWYFYIATSEEVYLVAGSVFLGFFYIGLGFVFFVTKFPETKFRKNRFVQIYL